MIILKFTFFFQRMDLNGDGVVSQDEFLETCLADQSITDSIVQFSNVIIWSVSMQPCVYKKYLLFDYNFCNLENLYKTQFD